MPALTSLRGRSPSGHPQVLAHGEVVGGIGQADGLDDGGEGDGALQLHHGDVVVVGVVVEVRVGDDALDLPRLHVGTVAVALVGQAQVGRPQAGVRVPASRRAQGEAQSPRQEPRKKKSWLFSSKRRLPPT